MTGAVIPQIRSGLRIIGAIGLHAVCDRVVGFWRRRRSDVIVILIIVIAVAVRSDNAPDDPAGDRTREENTAAMSMAVIIAAAVPRSPAALPRSAATANMRRWSHPTHAGGGWP